MSSFDGGVTVPPDPANARAAADAGAAPFLVAALISGSGGGGGGSDVGGSEADAASELLAAAAGKTLYHLLAIETSAVAAAAALLPALAGLPPLLQCRRRGTKLPLYAAEILAELVDARPHTADACLAAGCAPALSALLASSEDEEVLAAVATALAGMLGNRPAAVAAFGAGGGVRALTGEAPRLPQRAHPLSPLTLPQ